MANGKWQISNGRWSTGLLTFALCLLPFAISFAANDAYYNYLQGLLEERAGHPAKALDAYEKVVAEDPQALEAFRDIAELRLRMGQPDAALEAAQRVKELAPADPTSFLFLGNVFVAQGDLAKAAEAYENALKLDPENLRALENLGNYYAILDPDKSISYYQRYLDIDSRDADIYFQMGLVYQKKGDLAKAQSLYKESLELDPDQLASHLAMGDLFEEQKSTAAAIAEYQHAAQLQDTNPTILLRLGNLYYRDEKWDEAEKTFNKIETLAPQDTTAHYWLARIAEEKKNWKVAAAEVQQAYDLSQDPQFLPLLAYYLTLDRQLTEAVKVLEKARVSEPNNANVLMFLGMDYLDLDKPEKAREALIKGVALYPKDAQMRFQLAMTEDRLGHFDDAVREFQDLLAVDPKNAGAMNYLGYSWADKGVRLEESEKLVRQAVEIEPTNGAYLDSLGWVRYKRGDFKEARSALEKAVYYSPDPLIFEHLGDACLADQNLPEALQAYSKSISMDPKNAAVRKKIDDTAQRLFSSDQARKYSKYLEGNFKQIQSLQAHLKFDAGLNKHMLSAEGDLSYTQPDTVALHVNATKKMAAAQFQLKGGQHKVEPAETNPVLSQMAFEGMTSFAQLLSGKMTDLMQATIDPQTGVKVRFSLPSSSGGQNEMTIVTYDFIEGLWLPSDIRVTNSTTGWDAHLQFSDWAINPDDHSK
jgi:tetratricopeptide (TPR) repeat protein